MNWPNSSKKMLVLSGFFMAVILLGGRRANADFVFGEPVNLGSAVNSSSFDGTPNISTDGLEMYFQSTRPDGLGYEDLWLTTRQTIDDPWGPPVNLTTVNSQYREAYPSVSAGGLELYFSDYFYGPDRPGGQGGHDLWMTSRASLNDSWDTPVNLGPVINSSAQEVSVSISNDGLVIVFASNRAGGSGNYDLWMSTRPDKQEDWDPPVNLGPAVNSSGFDYECSLSYDGLALLFMSDRAGGLGSTDAWMTVRKSINEPWGPPVNLGPPVNTSAEDGNVVISADGRTLYFVSTRLGGLGGWDIWQTPILPIVDFNGDGVVAIEDLVRLIESWGKDDPAVDVGPMPWGDGKVDAADLEVFMSCWGQEIRDPTLVAHWKLDEMDGIAASDSARENDGTLYGEPIWRPAGGTVAGALELDGVNDHVDTGFAIDPAAAAFSVFAWVRGGAPGQVILSQAGGANWLMAAAPDGALMTELKGAGRTAKPLASTVSITDGAWHRVGFVWDGANRILYVDDVEVATDAQSSLAGSIGGLYIGVGSALSAGTFWSGLIDDVRVYSRAVKP